MSQAGSVKSWRSASRRVRAARTRRAPSRRRARSAPSTSGCARGRTAAGPRRWRAAPRTARPASRRRCARDGGGSAPAGRPRRRQPVPRPGQHGLDQSVVLRPAQEHRAQHPGDRDLRELRVAPLRPRRSGRRALRSAAYSSRSSSRHRAAPRAARRGRPPAAGPAPAGRPAAPSSRSSCSPRRRPAASSPTSHPSSQGAAVACREATRVAGQRRRACLAALRAAPALTRRPLQPTSCGRRDPLLGTRHADRVRADARRLPAVLGRAQQQTVRARRLVRRRERRRARGSALSAALVAPSRVSWSSRSTGAPPTAAPPFPGGSTTRCRLARERSSAPAASARNTTPKSVTVAPRPRRAGADEGGRDVERLDADDLRHPLSTVLPA